MSNTAVEELLFYLRLPTVTRPEAVHGYGCKYPKEGKRHGPCTCGARELDALLRQSLIDCKVPITECPDEVSERKRFKSGRKSLKPECSCGNTRPHQLHCDLRVTDETGDSL